MRSVTIGWGSGRRARGSSSAGGRSSGAVTSSGGAATRRARAPWAAAERYKASMSAGIAPGGAGRAARHGAQLTASSAAIIARRSSIPISSPASSTALASGGRAGHAERPRRSARWASAAAICASPNPMKARRSKSGSVSASALTPSTSHTKPSPRRSAVKAWLTRVPEARSASINPSSWSVRPSASSAGRPRCGASASSPSPRRWPCTSDSSIS